MIQIYNYFSYDYKLITQKSYKLVNFNTI